MPALMSRQKSKRLIDWSFVHQRDQQQTIHNNRIMAAEKTNWADAADEADKLASEVDSKASLEEEGPCSSCIILPNKIEAH
jgi:hypothetical protein